LLNAILTVNRQERKTLIKEIENLTKSRLLVYVTGDRKGLETRISSDVIPLIFKHIKRFGEVPKITLLLYTTGGITIAGYSIVNMIREFCKNLTVIVPYKALSTGTLMVLGANELIMSKMGQLGPVDPSIEHALGPRIPHPQNPVVKAIVPVNVEDVVSFFGLAKKEAKTTTEEELTKVFGTLSNSIHPLVLGAVNRSRDEIRFLAKTLLNHHIKNQSRIDRIVKTLVEERFTHNYIIGRKEAKRVLGTSVVDVTQNLDDKIMKLFDEYSTILKLDSPFNLELELGGQNQTRSTFQRCMVECTELTHTYTTVREITKVQGADPQTGAPLTQYSQTLIQEEWLENDTI